MPPDLYMNTKYEAYRYIWVSGVLETYSNAFPYFSIGEFPRV